GLKLPRKREASKLSEVHILCLSMSGNECLLFGTFIGRNIILASYTVEAKQMNVQLHYTFTCAAALDCANQCAVSQIIVVKKTFFHIFITNRAIYFFEYLDGIINSYSTKNFQYNHISSSNKNREKKLKK
ncbi:hypothetical protein ACJX0J_010406, partial [Zea mays]